MTQHDIERITELEKQSEVEELDGAESEELRDLRAEQRSEKAHAKGLAAFNKAKRVWRITFDNGNPSPALLYALTRAVADDLGIDAAEIVEVVRPVIARLGFDSYQGVYFGIGDGGL